MLQKSRPDPRIFYTLVAALFLLSAAAPLCAQSNDASFPTPVFTGELTGRIAPRDVGDPRRTRHFYTFRGAEGDLVINLETNELIGDVDVFTATGFRPLLKFTVLGDPARLTKSFYLRKEETLVLRVEARAVGDVEGTYRLSFGGSFVPAPADLANAPTPEPPSVSAPERRGGTRRVTATGARIEEPRVEPAPSEETAASPQPTPETTTGRRTPSSRRGRGARNTSPRSRAGTAPPRPAETTPETAGTKTTDETPAVTPAPTETPAPTPAPTRRRGTRTTTTRRNSSRESAGARRAEPAPPQPSADTQPAAPTPEPVTAQRLIIVTKDGETLERDMSGVRRVTVENNQVVIIGRDGKVTRRPLAGIVKMSIEP